MFTVLLKYQYRIAMCFLYVLTENSSVFSSNVSDLLFTEIYHLHGFTSLLLKEDSLPECNYILADIRSTLMRQRR